jgi:hypothetical protein
MNEPGITINPAEEIKSPVQMETKAYHPPHLLEWGDLQELTGGAGGIYQDADSSLTASSFHGKRPGNDPNFPLPLP